MYTVMIAEDELLVRIGIASSVPWMQMDMRLIAETTNGEAALEAFREYHPDIVITDIRMPKIDGMELIRRIREEDKDCAVIVITNVENEETLDSARRLGVVDFLLKASMKRDDITTSVLKARDSLPKGRGSAEMPLDNYDLWQEYLTSPKMTPEIFLQRCEETHSDCILPRGFIFMRILASESLSHRLVDSLINLFSHKLDSSSILNVIRMENDAVALMRNMDNPMAIRNLMRELARYVNDNFDARLIFVIMPDTAELGQLRQSIEDARRHMRHEALFDRPVLMMNITGQPEFMELREVSRKLHLCAILSGHNLMFSDCADAVMELPGALSAGWPSGRAIGMRILSALKAPQECSSVNDMIEAIIFATEQVFQRCRISANAGILSAIDYIEAHISEKISIRQVSETVGYHPAYFSSLFKREIGMSFSDFLTLVRIQRAKDMLKSSKLSLKEIGDSCGFADLSYFSNKFKLMTGVSPSQWRSRA